MIELIEIINQEKIKRSPTEIANTINKNVEDKILEKDDTIMIESEGHKTIKHYVFDSCDQKFIHYFSSYRSKRYDFKRLNIHHKNIADVWKLWKVPLPESFYNEIKKE